VQLADVAPASAGLAAITYSGGGKRRPDASDGQRQDGTQAKDPDKVPHFYMADEWTAFVRGVKAGEFDLQARPHPKYGPRLAGGAVPYRSITGWDAASSAGSLYGAAGSGAQSRPPS
jgi:hypothetical protein